MTPYFSQIIGFDISLEMICMKCQNLFSRKNKKNISKQNVLCWNFYLECQALRLLKQSLRSINFDFLVYLHADFGPKWSDPGGGKTFSWSASHKRNSQHSKIFYLKIKLDTAFKSFARHMKCQGIVCVEVLRPSQPNGVMLSVVSLPNNTFTGQA